MRILHVIRSVNPASGGTIEAVRQFIPVLRGQGHAVTLASLDAPADSWVRQSADPVQALGPDRPTHYGRSTRYDDWLRSHQREFDCVIVNGLWQYTSFGAWRALRGTATPYFVFPHGMLDPWFRRRYPLKHLKKWLYWPWAEYRVLRDARAVLYTCEEERLLARQSFWLYRATEVVTNLGMAEPTGDAAAQRELFYREFPSLRHRRVVLFLGRIHEKKGCDLLLEAFAECAGADPAWHLLMAGPDQTGWRAILEARAKQLGLTPRVTWPGMLSGDLKWGAFRAADVFILPSHQENFGLAVVEALACGVPVLISNRINIRREIQTDRAGLVAADTLAGTRDLLRRWQRLAEGERQAMRVAAARSFRQRFEIERAAQHLVGALRACGVQG